MVSINCYNNYFVIRSENESKRLFIKGTKGMNEIGPHKNWAEKIMMCVQAYVVFENDASYIDLFEV